MTEVPPASWPGPDEPERPPAIGAHRYAATGPDPVAAEAIDDWTPSAVEVARRAYRRRRSVRSAVIAAVATVVLVAVVVLVLVNTPGWPTFRERFFDLAYGWQVLPDIAEGLWLNIRLAVVCEIGILIVALTVALARTLRGPVFFPIRAAAVVYTDLFRGLPLILVLLLLGFGMPSLQARVAAQLGAVLGLRRADPHLRRVRVGGAARRHRIRAPIPASRRALARAVPRPDDAVRGRPAGGPPRHAAAAQRPGRAASRTPV